MNTPDRVTHEEVENTILQLVGEGKLIHNGNYRNGQPVYIHVNNATPEEIARWGGIFVPSVEES